MTKGANGVTEAKESEEQKLEQLDGTVDRIIFASADGKFTVFRMTLDRHQGSTVATYRGPAPLAGHQLSLQGTWVDHPRFGHQFQAERIVVSVPTSIDGIRRFLASGAIEGIRENMADRLLAAFGEEVLEVIEKRPSLLLEVRGIGQKTADRIHSSYMEKAELRDIMLWLESHGVSGGYAARIYKKYGALSLQIMEHTPYKMAREVKGIGFVIADTIAAGIGIDKEDDARIGAGLEYQLSLFAQDGHCCVPWEYLVTAASKMLQARESLVREVMMEELSCGNLEQEDVGDTIYVYSKNLHEAERHVARRLKSMVRDAESFEIASSEMLVRFWEEEGGITLAEEQRWAIQGALDHGVFILTGGPGTGKTTVIRGMIDILEDMGLEILLGAPTGRAAKRLSEATDRKASTIHRMLESIGSADGDDFGRNEDEPLEADVIVIDEVSMMDIMLMKHFLAAVPFGCHVIFVGDVDQLPSVGPGSVLKDMLRSRIIPQVRLTEVFRQQNASNIVLNAHAINRGRIPRDINSNGFYFMPLEDAQMAEDQAVEMYTKVFPSHGYNIYEDVQVLSPMHRGVCGVGRLNQRIQEKVNPPVKGEESWTFGERIFRRSDKVIQMKNNYEKKVYNGDIGVIQDIGEDKMTVMYAEQEVEYDRAEASEQLQLAYCMSVHKSQGSEYRVIILPLVKSHYIMLQRNLLYTAITRAKEIVVLVGAEEAFNTAVMNDRTRRRYSLLTERLVGAL